MDEMTPRERLNADGPVRRCALSALLSALLAGSVAVAAVPAASPPSQSVLRAANPGDMALIDALNVYIPALMKSRDIPGMNIALARHGQIVWEGAYGYADAKSRRPMRTDTATYSGSVTKLYAAIAIMQLVERGRLKLDDPINLHLPFEVRNPLGGPPITIRHLLTHTSGIGSDYAAAYYCGDPRAKGAPALEQLLRETYAVDRDAYGYAGGPSKWTAPTGASYQYSNLGIATAGLIVERANSEHLSYSEYVQRNILDPLGMRYAQVPPAQTAELTRPQIWRRLSVGYQTMGGAWIPTAQLCIGRYPAGGSFATPADHLRLMIAMANGGGMDGAHLLESGSVKEILSPQSFVPGVGDSLGLVFDLKSWSTPGASFSKNGAYMFGWNTFVISYPASQTAFAAASNEWTSLEWRGELNQVRTFVESWLAAGPGGPPEGFVDAELRKLTPPTTPSVPAIKNVGWKLSYLRGLLFAESYEVGIRMAERLTQKQARAIARDTDADLSAVKPAYWDAGAFVSGVRDVAALPMTKEALRDFVANGKARVSLEEAKQLYPLLKLPGSYAMNFAALGGLLQ